MTVLELEDATGPTPVGELLELLAGAEEIAGVEKEGGTITSFEALSVDRAGELSCRFDLEVGLSRGPSRGSTSPSDSVRDILLSGVIGDGWDTERGVEILRGAVWESFWDFFVGVGGMMDVETVGRSSLRGGRGCFSGDSTA